MLKLDLSLLENGNDFQALCYRIANKEFPDCVPVATGSHDKGMDIIEFVRGNRNKIVWQCKYSKANSLSTLKPKITQSLNSLDASQKIDKWILCVSKEATGKFLDWIYKELRKYKFIRSFEIWDKIKILQKLEKHPDIVEIFFYKVYQDLERIFSTEELELIEINISEKGIWKEINSRRLEYFRGRNDESDLLLDIKIRNKGTIEVMLSKIILKVYDVKRKLRGIPESSILLPKITYEISINNGEEGTYIYKPDAPLLIKPKMHERFQIKIKEIGYAWIGKIKISISYSKRKRINLPTILVHA